MRVTAQIHMAVAPTPTPVRRNPVRTATAPATPLAQPHRNVPSSPATSSVFANLFQDFSRKTNTPLTASTSTSATSSTPVAASTPVAPATAAPTPAAVQTPGIGALVAAIMNGTLKTSYVTDPAKLQETNPAGTSYMPNFYYASDETANQVAQLLGGQVIRMTPFGQVPGWNEPLANFIQLPGGQRVNAADLAYYGRCGVQGSAQLYADLTQTINVGSAWCNYYHGGGAPPDFPLGYVGPPISGMTYPPGMIAADGNVINPAMQAAARVS